MRAALTMIVLHCSMDHSGCRQLVVAQRAGSPPPPVRCDPKARPPEFCPGGTACPATGVCPAPSPTPPLPPQPQPDHAPNCSVADTVSLGAYFSGGRLPYAVTRVDMSTSNCSLDPSSPTACWRACQASAKDGWAAWELFVNITCKTKGCTDAKGVGLLPTDPPPLGSDVACGLYEAPTANPPDACMSNGNGYGIYCLPPHRSIAPQAQARSAVGCTELGIKYNASACCATYRCVANQCVVAPPGLRGLPKYLCEQGCYPPPPPPLTYDCRIPTDGNCSVQTDGSGAFNTSADCMASPSCAAPPVPAPPGGWKPDWMTFYELDVGTNGSGTTSFTNLVWGSDLKLLEAAALKFNRKAMWSFVSNCQAGQQVFGEPYCGGPTGLCSAWKVGVNYTVAQVRSRPWLVGLWLGDEPEILGVDYPSMCTLILYLKNALIQAGRGDVFLVYNDGPGSGQLSIGMCPGLDYFSIDSYADDPASEVGGVKAAYAATISKLRKPNPLESRGQGLWVVPGIFWGMASCTDRGGAGTAGTDGTAACSNASWCSNGTQCTRSPGWLVAKMQLYLLFIIVMECFHVEFVCKYLCICYNHIYCTE